MRRPSRWLDGTRVPWRANVRGWYASRRNMNADDMGEWLDVQLIADRSAIIGRMIVGPFVVLGLMILSRVRYFDRWDWRSSLVLIFATHPLFAPGAAFMLRRTAEAARRSALAYLREKLTRLKGSPASPGDQDARPNQDARAEQIKLTIADIEKNRRGAFASLSEHPLIAAILIQTGGIGTWTLLEVLFTH